MRTTLDLSFCLTLNDFELQLRESFELVGVLGVLGPSGSGKTSLLRTVAGLETSAQGKILLDGTIWQDSSQGVFVPPYQRGVGYVFQDARLIPNLTVAGNLEFAAKRAAASRTSVDANAVIDTLGLRQLLHRKPDRLSGGEQQRVAIARALVTCPRLLLMDEPLAASDLERRSELLPFLHSVIQRFELTTIYVSHSLNELATLAETLLVMRGGERVALGKTQAVMSQLDLGEVSSAEDAGSVLMAEVTGHNPELHISHVTFAGQPLFVPLVQTPVASTVTLHIHARDVALATEEPRGLSIRNILQGTITAIKIEEDGPSVDVVVAVGGQSIRARITRASLLDLALDVSKSVYVLIKTASVETA